VLLRFTDSHHLLLQGPCIWLWTSLDWSTNSTMSMSWKERPRPPISLPSIPNTQSLFWLTGTLSSLRAEPPWHTLCLNTNLVNCIQLVPRRGHRLTRGSTLTLEHFTRGWGIVFILCVLDRQKQSLKRKLMHWRRLWCSQIKWQVVSKMSWWKLAIFKKNYINNAKKINVLKTAFFLSATNNHYISKTWIKMKFYCKMKCMVGKRRSILM